MVSKKAGILLRTALEIAKKLERRPEGLLTQLYFGAGKLEFQKGSYDKAASFYRESILNASSGPATAKEGKATDEEVQIEKNAAQYSVGNAMALGLSQCLREQGRLEEAYPIAWGGRRWGQSRVRAFFFSFAGEKNEGLTRPLPASGQPAGITSLTQQTAGNNEFLYLQNYIVMAHEIGHNFDAIHPGRQWCEPIPEDPFHCRWKQTLDWEAFDAVRNVPHFSDGTFDECKTTSSG